MKYDSKSIPPAQPARIHVRRQLDSTAPIQHAPSVLLGHDDPAAYQSVRQAVNDEFEPISSYRQLLAERAAQELWRAMRSSGTEAAAVDLQIADQAPHVDRIYQELDSHCRTALTFRDQSFAHIKRRVRNEESEYMRRHYQATRYLERARKQ
jgi:hypothetical protein